jgi:hypothetical protein
MNEKRFQMSIINNETYHMHEWLFMDEIDHIYVIIMGSRLNVITWAWKKINVIFNTNGLYHAWIKLCSWMKFTHIDMWKLDDTW